LSQVHVTFILVFISQDDLNDGVLFPIVEFPLHLDVLPLSQAHKTTNNSTVEDSVLSSLLGFDCCSCACVLHDGPV